MPVFWSFNIIHNQRFQEKLKYSIWLDLVNLAHISAKTVSKQKIPDLKNLGDRVGFLFLEAYSECKSSFAQIQDLKHLKRYLICDAALMDANAYVSGQLDHCNSLFRNFSAFDLHKLQCVQNNLARIVPNTPHTQTHLERLSIGCLQKIMLHLRLAY